LHHIWGGNNVPNFYYLPVGQAANCSEDDLVGDTPNTIGWSSCNQNSASCENVRDNVQNTMDYSYCNVMFTEGQKTRMRAALNSPIANRNNLWTPANLIATGVNLEPALCEADFEADNTLICDPSGGAVNFTNTSYHGEIDSVYWEFPGGFPPFSVLPNPVTTYYNPGIFSASLTVFSEGNSATITKEDYITFVEDSSHTYPFWDWFEGNSNLNGAPWIQKSFDTDNNWEITEVASHSPSHSVWVDNWDNQLLTVDELYGPALDLSNASQMRLAFKYAFASQTEATNSTKLQVQVREDCFSNWSTRLTINGSNLATAANQEAPFVPTPSEWIAESINIPSNYLEEDFGFRFVFTSEGNNRLFLDDVNVDIAAGIEDLGSPVSNLSLYPNPASHNLTVGFELAEATDIDFQVIDVLGKQLLTLPQSAYTAGSNSQNIELESIKPGVYFLVINSKENQTVKRFIII
ncbi:MAG: T9SS type A sorting domain-containing protein, partial [Flavobacteriales bacterium]